MTTVQRHDPVVYFSAFDSNRPAGGLKVLYEHADALLRAGVDTKVVHQKRGFRCEWFANSVPVVSVDEIQMGPKDVLVVPEIGLDLLIRSGSRARHIVLNQSGHLTFMTGASAVVGHMLNSDTLLGSVVVSEHSRSYLRTAFPERPVEVVRNMIDPAVYCPTPGRFRHTLGYSNLRGADDIRQILHILQARGSLSGWEPFEHVAADQTGYARQLQQTRVLLWTPYQEGFGLPAAEGMACGAYVVGYHGYGGQGYLRPEFTSISPTGDVLSVAMALEDILARDLTDPEWLDERAAAGAAYIAREYSPEQARETIVRAYDALLGA